MTARAVTSSVNPRQRRGHPHDADAPRTRRRWHTPALHLQRHRPAVHISSSSLPGRCPGLTESGSALRTSPTTLAAASPVIAHLRSAMCGSSPDSPCVLAPLIRMGLLKIARLRRADITSPSPRAAAAEYDRASGHVIPHHRLSQQSRSMTAPSPRHIVTITALIVAERRHSAVTRYAERSGACRDSTRPCCRRAGGTPLPPVSRPSTSVEPTA